MSNAQPPDGRFFYDLLKSAWAQCRRIWANDWKEMIMANMETFFDRLGATERRVIELEKQCKAAAISVAPEQLDQAIARLDQIASSVADPQDAQPTPSPSDPPPNP